MSDPVQQAMDELNEAVSDYESVRRGAGCDDSCLACIGMKERIVELRDRYNALIIAYDSTQ